MDIASILSLLSALPTSLSTVVDVLSTLQLLGFPVAKTAIAIASVYLWLAVFFGLYVAVMGLYRVKLRGQLSRFVWVFGGPFVVLGIVVDVVSQYTLACLFFFGLPARREHTVTARMQRLRHDDPTGWRGRLAAYICESGLDPIDPSGDHC